MGSGPRGVAVVDTSVIDAELQSLRGLGIRGIRFNLVQAGATSLEMAEPLILAVGPWEGVPRSAAPRVFGNVRPCRVMASTPGSAGSGTAVHGADASSQRLRRSSWDRRSRGKTVRLGRGTEHPGVPKADLRPQVVPSRSRRRADMIPGRGAWSSYHVALTCDR
jgi:hypothetical protein